MTQNASTFAYLRSLSRRHCWDPSKTMCLRCNGTIRDMKTDRGYRRFFVLNDLQVNVSDGADSMPPCTGTMETNSKPRRRKMTSEHRKNIRVYLSEDALKKLEKLAEGSNRSAIVECLIREFRG